MPTCSATSSRWSLLFWVFILGGFAGATFLSPSISSAQAISSSEAEAGTELVTGEQEKAQDGESLQQNAQPDLSLYWLLKQGGWLMAPIYLMSILVVTFGIERLIGLRRVNILPNRLVSALGKHAASRGKFDPRDAFRTCQQYPSAAATVIRAMLLKVGRPHSELEHAVSEVSEREAARVYSNVRWLNLAAAVAPLLGLFGTVWGMIRAFYDTTVLPVGVNKADQLAQGIYVALVTTLGGLAVAIPAAILAHYLEGRIQSFFHQIDELIFNLLPQIENYEEKLDLDLRVEVHSTEHTKVAVQERGIKKQTAPLPTSE